MASKTDELRFMRGIGTKNVRNLEKPKPLSLKSTNPVARHSAPDVPQRIVLNLLEEVMTVVESLQYYITSKNFAEVVQVTPVLTNKLKVFGIQLEEIYKDQLDKAFVAFRDAAKDDRLDPVTRSLLLELVELRAMQWQNKSPAFAGYFSSKQHKIEPPAVQETLAVIEAPTSPAAHLGPGEVIKPSGKYPAPTRLQGKNYCKDEVVIRNADSGKVNPGAKERLVQITGPTEEKIILARNLMEDTIRKNASPVREIPEKEFHVGSSSSLNSSTSDDQGKFEGEMGLFGQIEPSELSYRHTLNIGDGHLFMYSDDFDLISKAKLALDTHFIREPSRTWTDAGTQYLEKDFIRAQPEARCLPHSALQPQNLSQAQILPQFQPQPTPAQTQASQQAAQKVAKRPRKPSAYVPFVCPPIMKPNEVRIEYSRDFLLNLSGSLGAKAVPPMWTAIASEFPSIIKQHKNNPKGANWTPHLNINSATYNDNRSLLESA